MSREFGINYGKGSRREVIKCHPVGLVVFEKFAAKLYSLREEVSLELGEPLEDKAFVICVFPTVVAYSGVLNIIDYRRTNPLKFFLQCD